MIERPTTVAATTISSDVVRTPRVRPVPAPAPAVPGRVIDEYVALLGEAGARLGTTLDLNTTAHELCTIAAPRFADWAAVYLVDQLMADLEVPPDDPEDRGPRLLRRVAMVSHRTTGTWAELAAKDEAVTLPSDTRTRLRDPLRVPVVDPAIAGELARELGLPALGPLLGDRSLLVIPLTTPHGTAYGRVLGRLLLLRHPRRRPFDAKDAATAQELAVRGALCLDNARLHRQESRAAVTLQRSMLPTTPPRIPGVEIAHRYCPGDRRAEVGGDWFDAVQLPGSRVALIVGDVMGHGLLSAAVMGQFRTAVQTMAALDLPPAQILRHLDNLAHRLGPDHLATCLYAVYDPVRRTCSLANAGHVPPVLAHADGPSELLTLPEGAPIGVGGIPFETVEFAAPDGSWLVMCTDGLVELRGQGIGAGLAALCGNVIEPRQTPDEVCDTILARLNSDDRRDDIALLVARFRGIAPQDVARHTLSLDLREVRRARALTRKQLADWGLTALTETAELLVTELVTNALRTATRDVELCLMRVGKLLVEVSDDDPNLPQLKRSNDDDEDGRGLKLVSNLSRRWGTSRKAVGKVVWFELTTPQEDLAGNALRSSGGQTPAPPEPAHA